MNLPLAYLYLECLPIKIAIGIYDQEKLKTFFQKYPQEIKKTILLICYKYAQEYQSFNLEEIRFLVNRFKTEDYSFHIVDQPIGIRIGSLKFNYLEDKKVIQLIDKFHAQNYPSKKMVKFLSADEKRALLSKKRIPFYSGKDYRLMV